MFSLRVIIGFGKDSGKSCTACAEHKKRNRSERSKMVTQTAEYAVRRIEQTAVFFRASDNGSCRILDLRYTSPSDSS